MKEDYLAHSAKNGFPAQSYISHVKNTTDKALAFAQEIQVYCRKDAEQIENILNLAAPYHDLGKLDVQNQTILHEEGEKVRPLPVNHVDAGAAFLKQKQQEAMFSLRLVYAHHRGLPDETKEYNRKEEPCYRDEDKKVRDYVDQELAQLLQIHQRLLPECVSHDPENCVGDPSVFFRMLMSCLADADHSDTASVYGRHLESEQVPKLQPALRLAALDHYVDNLQRKS